MSKTTTTRSSRPPARASAPSRQKSTPARQTAAPARPGATAAPARPTQQTAAQRAASGPAAQPTRSAQSAAPGAVKDQVQVNQDRKDPQASANLGSMFKSMGDWAQEAVPQGVQDVVKGAIPKVKEAIAQFPQAAQALHEASQLQGLVGSLKKDGLSPQNMDKLNQVLGKIDSPEAAQKLFKEHPQLAEALRGMGGEKLNTLFHQTGQNMRDCQTLYNILGPTKLGGADGRVTTGDACPIAHGAMRDPQFRDMARHAAASQLRKDGRRLLARIAENRPNLADRVVQKKGPGEMAGRLTSSLNSMGLNGPADPQRNRNLTYRELNEAALAGQRLGGEKNPRSLNQMVQHGVWNPQPNPTMAGLQQQALSQGQQALSERNMGESDFAQSALKGTINAIPTWVQGNQQEGVRKYWEANTHVHNLLRGLGVNGQ